MPRIAILVEQELRQAVTLDRAVIDAVADAFRALAGGAVQMPPILRLDIPEHRGEVDVKTAYIPGLESFALKVSPGFFDNPKLGLPSLNGLMIVFSARTGLVEALLLDNGYLTDIRTAAAGAVAAEALSRPDASRAGIVGAGLQAKLQLRALCHVRPIAEAQVWARDPGKAAAFAVEATARHGFPVTVAADTTTLCLASDVVVTTTPSEQPLIGLAALHPGLHITAMGSDAEHKNELAPELLVAADLYVCDRQSQAARLGELHHAIAAGLLPADQAQVELGQLLTGSAKGRSSVEQVTVCDLTGTGVQDTAIATLARQQAAALGLGTAIDA